LGFRQAQPPQGRLFSHLHIFTLRGFDRLNHRRAAYLHIPTSPHLHILIPKSRDCRFAPASAHQHPSTSSGQAFSHLHIFTLRQAQGRHLHISTLAHQHIFTLAHLHISTSAHLHISLRFFSLYLPIIF
jgi:hypothetical protein